MFKTARALALVATGAFTLASTAAQAAPAAPVANPAASLSVARAATPAGHRSKIGASVPTATLISIGVLAALTAIVLVATDSSDSK